MSGRSFCPQSDDTTPDGVCGAVMPCPTHGPAVAAVAQLGGKPAEAPRFASGGIVKRPALEPYHSWALESLDAEVRAMAALVAALEPLESDARGRVLRYLCHRYQQHT